MSKFISVLAIFSFMCIAQTASAQTVSDDYGCAPITKLVSEGISFQSHPDLDGDTEPDMIIYVPVCAKDINPLVTRLEISCAIQAKGNSAYAERYISLINNGKHINSIDGIYEIGLSLNGKFPTSDLKKVTCGLILASNTNDVTDWEDVDYCHKGGDKGKMGCRDAEKPAVSQIVESIQKNSTGSQ